MKKLLKLFVMCMIRHDDEYYKQGIKSMGVDYTSLTHDEIAAWKACCKSIEADFLINDAFRSKPYPKEKMDIIIGTLERKLNNLEGKPKSSE